MSSEIAWRAASFTSAGAAKSGKPCERLTALCFIARRVISRITDSVNCSALAEIMLREIPAIFDSGVLMILRSSRVEAIRIRRELAALRRGSGYWNIGLRAGSINHPVDRGIAQYDLHVIASFRKWNGLDQLGDFVVLAFGLPERDAVFAGVVSRQRVFRSASKLHQPLEIEGAEFDVVLG